MNPSLILFAIQAAVKLGRRLNDVLVDETRERPLLLPVGELLVTNVKELGAQDFFDQPENQALVQADGPYAGLSGQQLVQAYESLATIHRKLGEDDASLQDAVEIVKNLQSFQQLKQGFGAKPPLQRVVGTVVEIGVDYFTANPQALGKRSPQQRILAAFVTRLDDIDFSEETPEQTIENVLLAALQTLDSNLTLIDDDQRVQVLLGGITKALIEDVQSASGPAATVRRNNLIKRISSSILQGAATAASDRPDLFLEDNPAVRSLVQSTLAQILAGIDGKEDLFANASIERLVRTALQAMGENSEALTDNKRLQSLLSNTVAALTDTPAQALFPAASVAVILQAALETAGEHSELLLDPQDPRERLFADAVKAITAGLTSGNANLQGMLSRGGLVGLVQAVFREAAKDSRLLPGHGADPRTTALAQTLGSVALGLGDDPARLVTAAGFVTLARNALQIAASNLDKLIDGGNPDPRTNLLFKVLSQVVAATGSAQDPRQLLNRATSLDIATRTLETSAANPERLLSGADELVKQTVSTALELANGPLQNRVSRTNLPVLSEALLRTVLWNELDLADQQSVVATAQRLLKAA